MKITFINSSGRSNGNTERLLKLLDNQLIKIADERNIALDIQHVLLSRRHIQICSGCRSCLDKGNCPLKDDVAEIGELVSDCDAFVLASPVYLEDVNGIMKNWFDRMAFYSHRPAFYGKCAIAISTSGSGSSNHTLNTMKNALTAWGVNVLCVHKLRMGAHMEDDHIKKQYTSKLSNIATNLIDSIQNNNAQKPKLFSLISFNIQQRYYKFSDRAGTLDRTYWEKKGWLDTHTHFYMSIRTNPAKMLFARVVGALLSKLFI